MFVVKAIALQQFVEIIGTLLGVQATPTDEHRVYISERGKRDALLYLLPRMTNEKRLARRVPTDQRI